MFRDNFAILKLHATNFCPINLPGRNEQGATAIHHYPIGININIETQQIENDIIDHPQQQKKKK